MRQKLVVYMGKKYDVITVMDTCVDMLFSGKDVVPEFGQKEKLVEDYNLELGGSCCIFACQTAKLGLKTAGIGTVGQDVIGRLVLEKLRESGVLLEHIKIDQMRKTGIGVTLCAEGDRAILTYIGSIDSADGSDVTDEILKNTRHIHIGSYYLMKKIQPCYRDIVLKAKEYGVSVSLDTNWDPDEKWDGGLWDILPYVDIFLPNENEAMAITKKDNIGDAISELSKIVPVICLKMGKRGAAAYFGGRMISEKPLDVKVVDAVGAGDSFDAGFIYGFLKGYVMEKCLKIGCICGSMNTTQAGGIAGQIYSDKLNETLKD